MHLSGVQAAAGKGSISVYLQESEGCRKGFILTKILKTSRISAIRFSKGKVNIPREIRRRGKRLSL